jgi:hypothetical protein
MIFNYLLSHIYIPQLIFFHRSSSSTTFENQNTSYNNKKQSNTTFENKNTSYNNKKHIYNNNYKLLSKKNMKLWNYEYNYYGGVDLSRLSISVVAVWSGWVAPWSWNVSAWTAARTNDKTNKVSKQYDKIMSRNIALSNVWNVNKRHHE